jgi:hypothetical protein
MRNNILKHKTVVEAVDPPSLGFFPLLSAPDAFDPCPRLNIEATDEAPIAKLVNGGK